jgi:hypothetical protein
MAWRLDSFLRELDYSIDFEISMNVENFILDLVLWG